MEIENTEDKGEEENTPAMILLSTYIFQIRNFTLDRMRGMK